jgi:hypothetical protein
MLEILSWPLFNMLPCNIDDATFLSTMNMGQSYSHDQWYEETPSEQYDQQDYV